MFEELLLNTFDFINDMKISEYNYLKSNIYYREIEKGGMIFGTHKQCESIPMVLRGSMRLFRVSDEGREMTSYFITPGNICVLAALCTIGKIEYNFTAQAEEDTLLIMLSPESFKHLLDTSLIFKNFVFLEMADKLITAFTLIDDIKFTKIENRLITYIKKNVNEKGELLITHENLAVNIGTAREVVSRQLKKMEKSGAISMQRKKIKLLSP